MGCCRSYSLWWPSSSIGINRNCEVHPGEGEMPTNWCESGNIPGNRPCDSHRGIILLSTASGSGRLTIPTRASPLGKATPLISHCKGSWYWLVTVIYGVTDQNSLQNRCSKIVYAAVLLLHYNQKILLAMLSSSMQSLGQALALKGCLYEAHDAMLIGVSGGGMQSTPRIFSVIQELS